MFPERGCFFHHFPTSTEVSNRHLLCILALCWAHYWFLKRSLFQPQRLYRSSQLFLCPPQRSISENEIILTLLDYTFYFSVLSVKPASFLLGRLPFSLPSFFPITATTAADEMAVQCVALSFGQLFLMNHHRRRDSCAVPCCAYNACTAPIMIKSFGFHSRF